MPEDCTLPEQEAVLSYVAGFDAEGCSRALDQPIGATNRILIWDAATSRVQWNDEDATVLPIQHYDAVEEGSAIDTNGGGVVVSINGTEEIVSIRPPTDGEEYVVVMRGENAYFVLLNQDAEIPEHETETGILVIQTPGGALEWFGPQGLVFINEDGEVTAIDGTGLDGAVLRWDDVAKVPVFSLEATGGSVAGGGSGLEGVIGSRVTTSTATWTFGALILRDAAGTKEQLILNYNETLNTATIAAPNGMEVSLAANTWYYVYAISEEGTPANISILASTSASGPNMGGGWDSGGDYDVFALIGMFRTDNSSNIVNFKQVGRDFTIDNLEVSRTLSPTNSGWTAVPINAGDDLVPPNAVSVSGIVGGNNVTADANSLKASAGNRACAISGYSDGFGHKIPGHATYTSTSFAIVNEFRYWMQQFENIFVNPASPTLYLKSLLPTCTNTRLVINGFRI